jgi:hypothetical protein
VRYFRSWLIKTVLLAIASASFESLVAQEGHHEVQQLRLGPVSIAPEAFIDGIGEWRSATTLDTVWTQFGRIPLSPTDSQSLFSFAHSRGMAHVDLRLGQVKITTYLEQDFMKSKDGVPFRWRQYWTEAKIGRWEVLGGQTWSLLRPNRVGIEPERALMNTDVIEPNYQVGIVGQRYRQMRLSYSHEGWKAAVAWEGTTGFWIGKYARDSKRTHLEVAGLMGRGHVTGVSLAQIVHVAPKIHLVAQQFASKHALTEALGVVPRGASGASILFGAESPLTAKLEVFGYYGFVYGSQSSSNRFTSQSSGGFRKQLWRRKDSADSLAIALQYSHVNRAVWSGAAGAMNYMQTSFRYTFN